MRTIKVIAALLFVILIPLMIHIVGAVVGGVVTLVKRIALARKVAKLEPITHTADFS